MKKLVIAFAAILSTLYSTAQSTVNIMNEVVFFDGYASVVSDPTPAGVIRFRNDLLTKQISSQQLDSIGDQLTIKVTISALCDNYDRIGGVNLAMVPKGSTTYNTETVPKIEIGRFITPFMNKNVQPTSVPYTFVVNNIAQILNSSELNALYDFWLELEVFGVPYAANTQVSGCSGRNDVFQGRVDFITNNSNPNYDPSVAMMPLSFKANFNNYQAGASDAVGTTVKTINFTTTQAIYDAKFYLITSNHGAGNNGEEYVRRVHNVSFDGNPILTYTPGGKSCEPYRQYNTQGNGIYGSTPQSASWWTSWNNWCPGDTIAIRKISLGTLAAGNHSFQIAVPAAQFSGQDGNFPLSLYLQGSKIEVLGLEELNNPSFTLFPNPAKDAVQIQTEKEFSTIELIDASGKRMLTETKNTLNLIGLDSGIYIIQVHFTDGMKSSQRFIKQ
ncbi:peptide-N-glycosidase F-related protein [Fluviicola sp.]|uniref:peptide-N-glycosidase F-related protein n=1 Tax=Fluviicola sp. TaxID=1917219 RepID=UPI003D2BFF30